MNALKVILSKRGLEKLLLNAFAFIGAVAVLIQIVSFFYYPDGINDYRNEVVLSLVSAACLYGLWRAWPKSSIERTYNPNNFKVKVVVSDILKYDGQIVVGFSDTFDTNTEGDRVISKNSLQGQFLEKKYNGDTAQLDRDILNALKDEKVIEKISKSKKKLGKLGRYAIGTVAVLGDSDENRVYALAYSHMGTNLVAESSVDNLWQSINKLWDTVYVHGQHKPVAIPLIGSGLSRINYLDSESLLRMTLISYIARSREKLISKELIVCIRPADREKINMLELEAFLKHI